MATSFSVVLHAAMIFAAGLVLFPRADAPGLIRVSLLGGGHGGEVGGPSASAASKSAAVEPVPVEPVPPHDRVEHPSVVKPHASVKRAPIGSRNHRHRKEVESEPQVAVAGSDSISSAASAASEGTGGDAGGGNGSGLGAGSGSGTGFGSGHGEGGDLRAFCVRCPKPQYPRVARLRGWEGTVDVDVDLGTDGSVSTASIAASSGFAVLDEAALAAARQSRFQLATASAGAGLRGRIAYGFRLSATVE